MNNPVLQALANAKLREQAEHDAALDTAVSRRLNLPAVKHDASEWPIFKTFCEQNGLSPHPARPSAVAAFVLANHVLGIGRLLKTMESISAVHEGVADPTLSPMVSAAMQQVSPIEPPRSWPKADKSRFLALSRDLQSFFVSHENTRDREIRRAHNEAATLRHKLKSFEKQETENGTDAKEPAGADRGVAV